MGAITEKLVQRHPLQRMESPSRATSAALHIAGLSSFAYSFKYLVDHPGPINESYGWHMQQLTIIGLALTTLAFATGLLADVFLSRTLFRTKNVLAVTAAPLEAVISVLYWGLRSIDPRLVLPEWAPPISLAADVSFHAVPAVVLFVDLLLFSPPWTISFLPAAALSSALATAYWFWVEHCYQKNGFYPYPIFEQLETGPRAALFGGSAVAFLMSLATLKKVQAYLAPMEKPGDVKGKTQKPKNQVMPDSRYQA